MIAATIAPAKRIIPAPAARSPTAPADVSACLANMRVRIGSSLAMRVAGVL